MFSKEKFASEWADIISFGKLRASFGLNGNVNKDFVGNYTVQGAYAGSKYNGNAYFLLNNLPNPYLKWEKSRTFEIGLDLGFLANRINANLTYYNLSLIHISEPTRQAEISYAVFCLKKKKTIKQTYTY